MITAIVALPLLGFLIAGIGGKQLGARACEIITTAFLMVAAAFSWVLFFQYALGSHPGSVSLLGDWFTVGTLKVDWALRVDALTAVMLVVVTTVSALVHLYSIGYMAEDPSQPRFFAYLSLFTFAMLMLVTADNLVQMFFGWEGVGLASYLLIGFWYEADRQCRGDQGLRGQPRRRFRLPSRDLHRLLRDAFGVVRHDLCRGARPRDQDGAPLRP